MKVSFPCPVGCWRAETEHGCYVSPLSAQHQAQTRGSGCLMKQEGPAFLILMGLCRKGTELSDFQDQAVHPHPTLGTKRSLTTSLESCGEDPHSTPLHSTPELCTPKRGRNSLSPSIPGPLFPSLLAFLAVNMNLGFFLLSKPLSCL